jgi:hypothetical protein
MQTSFTGRFNIYDIILEKHYFEKQEDGGSSVSREDATLINVAFSRCQSYKAFYCCNLPPFHGHAIILCYKATLPW